MRPPETRPEQLLRQMTVKYPGAWQWFERCRRDKGQTHEDDWPDWCYVPMAAAHAWVFQDLIGDPELPPDMSGLSLAEWQARMKSVQLLAALAGWRMGRGIYKFDPALAEALIATPLDGDIPVEMLYRLPEWCLYITAPSSWPDKVRGFFVHLEMDANTGCSELRLLYDHVETGPIALPLHMHENTIEQMTNSMLDTANRTALEMGLSKSPLTGHAGEFAENMRVHDCLNLILYLCADDADFGCGERPRNPEPTKTKRGIRLFPASGISVWEIGKTVGDQIRAAQTAERQRAEERNSPRPHLRRAHWHTYRVGKGRAEIRVRWLHPILVGYDK